MKLSIAILIALSITVAYCAQDYRTDREKANGIELTPEQIEVRKIIERQEHEARMRELEREFERMRMRRLESCPFQHYLDCL